MKKNTIYMLRVRGAPRLYEGIYKGTIDGFLFFFCLPFAPCGTIPDNINGSDIEWIKELCPWRWDMCEDILLDARQKLFEGNAKETIPNA